MEANLIGWLQASWHKLLIVAIVVDRAWDRVANFIERFRKAEEFIERRIHERRYEDMINLSILADLPKDLALLATIVPKIQAAIPLIQKNAQDISQAIADQKNPEALVADINTLLNDLTKDLAALESILPPSKPTPPAVAA